jgi:hypothetical protein
MQRYRFELILGAVFLVLLLAYCFFVSTSKLSNDEAAQLVAKIDAGLQMPEPMRSEFLARVRAWGEADDGDPVYLANIFHANDAEEMQKALWPGLDIKPAADGEKTHEIYLNAVKPLILPKGVWPAIGTKTQGISTSDKTNLAGFYPGFDEWTEININRYPGRRTILELFSHPTYLKVMPYKLVGLRLLTVPTTLRFQMPDLRLALGGIFLIIFLAVGWIRAERRNR